MLAESDDQEEIIARVAALDIGKAELVCCVRLPAPRGSRKRLQEVSTHSTMTASLTELANHVVELGVQRVVMEATSDYWKPVFWASPEIVEASLMLPPAGWQRSSRIRSAATTPRSCAGVESCRNRGTRP